MLKIEVDVSSVNLRLRLLSASMRGEFWNRFAPVAEAVILREQRRHFDEERAPNGQAWPPLSQMTLEIARGQAASKVGTVTGESKNRHGGITLFGDGGKQASARVRRNSSSRILRDTGILQASVTAASGTKGAIRSRRQGVIEIGTRLPYAKMHQAGWEGATTAKQRGYLRVLTGKWIARLRVPARPFLGMGERARKELLEAASATLRRVLR